MNQSIDELEFKIRSWDGKSADQMSAVFNEHTNDAFFIDDLIVLTSSPHLQNGTTWLIKRHIDQGGRLTVRQADAFLALVPGFEQWESQLHALQSLHALSISAQYVETLELFLRSCLNSQKKFVRAWAYSGFYELAAQYPAYQSEVSLMLSHALENEAGSIKARVRNVLKKKKF